MSDETIPSIGNSSLEATSLKDIEKGQPNNYGLSGELWTITEPVRKNKSELPSKASLTPTKTYNIYWTSPEADASPRYFVEPQPFAKGGMSDVYKAWDTHLEQYVAIKVLREKDFPEYQGIEIEAKTQARITNYHVVQVLDFVTTKQGPAIIMEYIEAPTLKRTIKYGALNPTEILQITKEVAETIEYMAKKEIYHADLKPSNIFVMPDNEIKITDFGISSWVSHRDEHVVGTPRYLAPELYGSKIVDPNLTSETYSLGVITYEMLTKRHPLGVTLDEEVRIPIYDTSQYQPVTKDFIDLEPDQLERLNQVLLKAVHSDYRKRYQTPSDFYSDLAKVLGVQKGYTTTIA